MTVFDLLFIVLFLATVGCLFYVLVTALRGRWAAAGRVLKRLGIAAVAYLALVYAVAIPSTARVLSLGEALCSDDWCISVESVDQVAGASVGTYEATFRLSSRARRVSQREKGVLVYLRDDRGRRYDAEAGVSDEPFDVRLEPGEAIVTHRRFFLPGATARELVVTRSGLPFPRCCIIGEATAILHPPRVRIS